MASLKTEVDKLDVNKLMSVPVDLSKLSDEKKKTHYDTKITEMEGKIPDVSSLAIKTTLTTVENKIPVLVVLSRKQIMIQKLLKLKKNLLIIIMINILLLPSLIL